MYREEERCFRRAALPLYGIPAESVHLSKVTDIEPYIEGSRRIRATAFCSVPPV